MIKFKAFNSFSYIPILGGREEGVTRRDPSPVINHDGIYYVWYTKTTETYHGYTGTIWYATSEDGFEWVEQEEAVSKGEAGSFDEQAVFTPSILLVEGKYYMTYTAVPKPFINDGSDITKTAIGMAVAESPTGPWKKNKEPILKTSDDENMFDSLRIDDTCFIVKNKQYYMYYKGRQINHTPAETKMGVAISKHPEGPYVKYEGNPVLESGHEVCVWPYAGGVCSLVCNVGPQGNTIQYSNNGLRFKKVFDAVPPKAPGPFREDDFVEGSEPGLKWGICMREDNGWPYLLRFDCDLA